MLVRREAIDQVGMMDEQFFMYGEETDWCYRFKKAGWKIMFTPQAQIIHLGGRSGQSVRGKMLVQVSISILQFIRKHRGWLAHIVCCFLMMLFFFVRLPIWLAVALLNENKRKQAFIRIRAYFTGVTESAAQLLHSIGRVER